MSGPHPAPDRRRPRSSVALVSFALCSALVLGACGTSGGSSGSASNQQGGGDAGGSLDGLTIERQPKAAVSKTVGVEGGTISVEAEDGTSFTFDVPAGALAEDTKITATPASLGGTDIPASLVMFEPTGLFFVEPATLEVTPARRVPAANELMFGISDDASEIVAAPPADTKSKAAVIQVGHFSGWGLANVTEPQRAAMLERQASAAEARIQSHMAEVVGEERRSQLLGVEGSGRLAEEFDKAAKEYEEQVIKPRLEAAGASCAATQKAVQTVLGYERQRQLLGAGEGSNGFNASEIVLDALRDGGPCEREAIAECKAKEDPAPYLQFLLGRERLRQLLGDDSGNVGDLIEKAERTCSKQRYAASGGGSGLEVGGTIDDLSKPFTLTGSFPGAEVTFSYEPSDDRSGTYEGSFSGSGVTGSVSGTYTIAGEDGDVLTLTGKEGGCVDQVAGSCRNNTQVLTLTPLD